ncbi:hypothetical protein BaRGS_00024404 [Batillaria attramentaria]|uniref:Uncharacterized protein n=1 Tax=Batillaria attramentaria TaxID=370345 RepID=A0ABD0KBE9_9CAEN
MGRAEEDLPKPCSLEEYCCGPLFPNGARDISISKQAHTANIRRNKSRPSGTTQQAAVEFQNGNSNVTHLCGEVWTPQSHPPPHFCPSASVCGFVLS